MSEVQVKGLPCGQEWESSSFRTKPPLSPETKPPPDGEEIVQSAEGGIVGGQGRKPPCNVGADGANEGWWLGTGRQIGDTDDVSHSSPSKNATPGGAVSAIQPYTDDRTAALACFDGAWARLKEIEVQAPPEEVPQSPPSKKSSFGRSKSPAPPKPPPTELVKVEENMAQIRGGLLMWSARYGPDVAAVEMHVGRIKGEAVIELDGRVLFAQMATERGLTMRWSDGEVWHRCSTTAPKSEVLWN